MLFRLFIKIIFFSYSTMDIIEEQELSFLEKDRIRARATYANKRDIILARLQKKYAVNQDYKEATKARALARYYRMKTEKNKN